MKGKLISGSKRTKVVVVLAVAVLTLGSQVMAQTSLRDILTERGFDWLIGHCEAVNDKGQKIQVA